tara:strand:+ start:810 stop:1109 length:300 start_codon:yes stop_codon:yes gene_type:complete
MTEDQVAQKVIEELITNKAQREWSSGNGWIKKDSAKDWSISPRFKGTVAYTKERNVWCLRVTDNETNQLVQATEMFAHSIDTAITRAKDMAREWEKDNE